MDIDVVHPELREMAMNAPTVDVSKPAMRVVGRLGARYLTPRAKEPGVSVRNVRAGGVRLRLYVPDEPSGAAMLWIHGGGMVIGAPRQDDRFCARTAAELGLVIASADYRLAPEHPHPTPLEDCHGVWQWLLDNAPALGVDADRIAVGGASAGGGIAAALVNRLHDEGGVAPAAQWLLYPMLDDRTAADRSLDEAEHFIWTNASNRVGWESLLRGVAEPGVEAVPAAASPARREHLGGLPPTWIGVGSIDLFRDEDRAYAERLAAAGVPVDFAELEGAPHGFESLAADAPVVRAFITDGRRWLGSALGAS